jgi:hypothetical protein
METMNGMFRGICVDNKDPKNLGRIRVQVPQMLGAAASGWAFPAWSFHQKTIWPQDRLPKPGDGVWVMFDATSPDKMIWVGAFGALDLINQPEFVEAPDFASTLTMSLTGTPTWNTTVTFSGALGSDLGGVPNPNPTVVLTGRQAGGDWVSLGSAVPDPLTGAWTLNHLVRLTGAVEYRATFTGVGVYGATSSEVIAVNTPVVTFPTSLVMAITGTPALNGPITLSGNLLTTGSPPVGYEVPKPGATVNVNCRPVGSSAWQAAVSNVAVNPSNGAWTSSYTITIPGAVEYQAVFGGLDVFLPSVSAIAAVDTSVGTVVSAPSLPALTYGSGFNISGTIKVNGTGENVVSGLAELWWRYTVGGDQAWKKSSVSQTITAGTYSMTHPSLSILGATEWQVRYVGDTKYDPANSAAVAATVNLPAHGALTKGAVTHSTAQFSWAAVSGATGYEVQIWNGSTWLLKATLGSGTLTFTDTGLTLSTQYFWRVRPKAADPAGTVMYGTASAYVSMATGRPQQTSSGTSSWIPISATAFDCHRADTGWQSAGEMRQGYFSSPYGGEGYIGVANYGATTIKNAIIAAVGQSAFDNGSCADAQVTLYRSATGSVGAATVSFYTTTSGTSGSRPTLQGTKVDVAASGYSASKTYNIGTAHGDRLGKAQAGAVAIYRNDSANYLGLNGSGTNGGKLELKWTWNYVSVSYIAPAWV